MNIETVEDLANQICDWVGCYGCCKNAEHSDDCYEVDTFCCRVGAMMVLPDRIRKAVENDTKLQPFMEGGEANQIKQ